MAGLFLAAETEGLNPGPEPRLPWNNMGNHNGSKVTNSVTRLRKWRGAEGAPKNTKVEELAGVLPAGDLPSPI